MLTSRFFVIPAERSESRDRSPILHAIPDRPAAVRDDDPKAALYSGGMPLIYIAIWPFSAVMRA